ncbi:MAG: NAD-binding protein [Deltaproteobacteria bacterium]|nr:NAD-binding protein [Deltaproteobacteria bacterium]
MEPLGLEVLRRLRAEGLPAGALLTHEEARDLRPVLDELGVVHEVGAPPWAWELEHMQLRNVGVLVFAGGDESVNVDAALVARHQVPDLPVLVRLDDPALRRFVQGSVPGVEVFSTATAAAPVAVERAMALLQQPRGAVGAHRQLAGLLLGVMPRPSALFWSVFVAFVAILLPTAWYFSRELHLSFLDAVYFVWVTVLSVGYGDINLRHASDEAKIVGMVVMLLGSGFMAAMIGLLADWLLTRRLGSLFSRVSVHMAGHVVVVGAGTVGAQVAELLRRSGLRVVVIEADADAHNVALLRSQRIPVVLGDATIDDTLDLASVWSAGAVLALTDQDSVNLHLGLRLSEQDAQVPVVARITSQEIARHVEQHCPFGSFSPMATTAAAVHRRTVELRGQRKVDHGGGGVGPGGRVLQAMALVVALFTSAIGLPGCGAPQTRAEPVVAPAPVEAPPAKDTRTLAEKIPLPTVLEDDGDAPAAANADGLDGAAARVFLRANPGPFQYVAYEITARGSAGVVSHLRGMMGRRDAVIRTELISRDELRRIFARLRAEAADRLPDAPPLEGATKDHPLPNQSPQPIYELSLRLGGKEQTVQVRDPMAADHGAYARFVRVVRAEVRAKVGDIAYHGPDAAEGASGYLFVDSVPSTDVYVDGEKLPERTPVLNWTLAPGQHTVRLVRTDKQIDKTYKIRIEAGLTSSVEVDLR